MRRARALRRALVAGLLATMAATLLAAFGSSPASAGPYESSQYFSVDISAAPDAVWHGYPTTFNVVVTDKANDNRALKNIYIAGGSLGTSCTNTQFPAKLVNASHTLSCTVPSQAAGVDFLASITINANITNATLGNVVKWNDRVTADKTIGWESKGIDVSIEAPQPGGYMAGTDVELDLTATNTGTVPLDNVLMTGLPGANCSFFLGTLQPGESRVRSCTRQTTVTTLPYQFSAQATGYVNTPVVPYQAPNVSDTTDVWVNVWLPVMGVEVALSDDQPAGWLVGDPMYTDISVTNTSNVTADIDVDTPGYTCPTSVVLAAGATHTYRCDILNKTADFAVTANATATPAGLSGFGTPTASDTASETFEVLTFGVTIHDLRTNPAASTIPVRIDVENRVWNPQIVQLVTGFSQCNQPSLSVPGFSTVSVYCTITSTSDITMTAQAKQGWQLLGFDSHRFSVGPKKPSDVIITR